MNEKAKNKYIRHVIYKGIYIFFLFFTLISIFSYSIKDDSLNSIGFDESSNLLGGYGSFVADIFLQLFGYGIVILAFSHLYIFIRNLFNDDLKILKIVWKSLFLLPATSLFLNFTPYDSIPNGGFLGKFIFDKIYFFDNFPYFFFLAVLAFIVFLYACKVFFGIKDKKIYDLGEYLYEKIYLTIFTIFEFIKDIDIKNINQENWKDKFNIKNNESKKNSTLTDIVSNDKQGEEKSISKDDNGLPKVVKKISIEKNKPKVKEKNTSDENQNEKFILQKKTNKVYEGVNYKKPDINLLNDGAKENFILSDDELRVIADKLQTILNEYNIMGEITNIRPGPVVTLYEFEPAAGIKSAKIISLAEDIARSMAAISCRVAVIRGKNVIGIELPNEKRETVALKEILLNTYQNVDSSKLMIALGKEISGNPVMSDLTKMPHLLIAGTTGSGKSVGINAMILSLLLQKTPEECRMIMIDPKMLELSIYDNIPHLLTPVVTDPKKSVYALKWAVKEMEERYLLMSKVGVRNLEGLNEKITKAKAKNEPLKIEVQNGIDMNNGELIYETEYIDHDPLPHIVLIIDEMADLMMVAGKDVEIQVQRLAQMARASGIHLIMATQRPSVDVITGTIKANFPTRISFQVTSKIDSRTILGEQGSEQLLGKGDMLFMQGGGRIKRIHGAFVSDDEVQRIVDAILVNGRANYASDISEFLLKQDDDNEQNLIGNSENQLYNEAVKIVLRDQKATISYIQRKLSIGYNKAANLIEMMEENNVVTPPNASGKREIIANGKF